MSQAGKQRRNTDEQRDDGSRIDTGSVPIKLRARLVQTADVVPFTAANEPVVTDQKSDQRPKEDSVPVQKGEEAIGFGLDKPGTDSETKDRTNNLPAANVDPSTRRQRAFQKPIMESFGWILTSEIDPLNRCQKGRCCQPHLS